MLGLQTHLPERILAVWFYYVGERAKDLCSVFDERSGGLMLSFSCAVSWGSVGDCRIKHKPNNVKNPD